MHLNKPGIRVLGVAESFRETDKWSTLAGVVMRRDLVIDGCALSLARVGGDDATKAIVSLFRKQKRSDVNAVIVSGCIISKYNIVDVDRLGEKLKIPVVCLTYKETSGIEGAISSRFEGDEAERKLVAYRKLGRRQRCLLKTGFQVFVRLSYTSLSEASALLSDFTLQGSVPEPVKVANLFARAANSYNSH
ncbi:MAG TPA: DUF99 family protein [Nitrososphaerales archaeon]|nr:DUF99 family protein [Nitrososphaerales archaeon]